MASIIPASLTPSNSNYSLYTIPIAWLLAISPRTYVLSTYKRFDNTQPRGVCAKLEADPSLDKATKGRLIRCEGAQQNGFENLPLFAAAVVAGNAAGVSAGTMNALSAAWLVSRVVYNVIYVGFNQTKRSAGLRTLTYLVGIGFVMSMFVLAGRRFQGVA